MKIDPKLLTEIRKKTVDEVAAEIIHMKTAEQRAIEQHLAKPRPISGACGCVGPRDGDPVCPCRMKWIEKVDGIYYQIYENRTSTEIGLKAEKLIVLTQEDREAQARENILKSLKASRLPG